MTLQSLAAVAAVADLAVIACACAAGFLLARGTRLPGWAAAVAMLLIIRAISMSTAHAWDTPSGTDAFPYVDVVVGSCAAAGLAVERMRAKRTPMAAAEPHVMPTAELHPEAHADAA